VKLAELDEESKVFTVAKKTEQGRVVVEGGDLDQYIAKEHSLRTIHRGINVSCTGPQR